MTILRNLGLGMLSMALLLTAGIASAAITGTAHDFQADAWNPDGEICEVCHTPHNADTSVADAPLWNHEVTATATFTIYSSTTLQASVGQPDGVSKLCLSCHDGSVALDSFGGATGSTNISGNANVGTDLSNDHPISFTYDAALVTADGGGLNAITDASGIGGGTIASDLLFGGNMECSSCHDVHDDAAAGAGGFLLVKSNAASALCLTCHAK